MHRGKQGTEELNDACVCWCVSAGWYYYQLNARVGWMASVLSLEHSLFTLINTTNSTPANCKACICLLMPLQSKKSSGIWIYTRTMLVPHIVVRWTISLDAHMPAIIRHWRLFWIQWSPLLSLCGQIFLPFRKLLRAADQAAKTRKVQMNHLFGHLYQEIVSALSMKVKTSFNVNSQHVPEEDLC